MIEEYYMKHGNQFILSYIHSTRNGSGQHASTAILHHVKHYVYLVSTYESAISNSLNYYRLLVESYNLQKELLCEQTTSSHAACGASAAKLG